MLDEVYNYGSFKQSKMFAAGVTCSDCHDPHGAKLRLPIDTTCLQCHDTGRYEDASHHHHAGVNPALSCASCHMPVRTYMVIDPRHDHSFRVPRPDLSIELGMPNACNDCHKDKTASWATSAIDGWFGPKREGFQRYAAAFDATWHDKGDATRLLEQVAGDSQAPAFARASALAELAPFLSPENETLAQASLSDPDPMVRIGALDMLETIPPAQLWGLASPLLSDPVRGVRIRAAELLAAAPTANQSSTDQASFEGAAAEFVAAQRLNADRPEARTTLGAFFARRGQSEDAEAEYRAALRLSPQFAPAAVNLSDLYRQLGKDAAGEEVLREALVASPMDGGLHYALGLALIRLKRSEEAIAELRQAAELQPERSRYAYVYAVALQSTGHAPGAVSVLKDSLLKHPDDRDTLMALATFTRDAGDLTAALGYAERLAYLAPHDTNMAAFVADLRSRLEQSKKP
jgi:Flp pilus assembly protein TadD